MVHEFKQGQLLGRKVCQNDAASARTPWRTSTGIIRPSTSGGTGADRAVNTGLAEAANMQTLMASSSSSLGHLWQVLVFSGEPLNLAVVVTREITPREATKKKKRMAIVTSQLWMTAMHKWHWELFKVEFETGGIGGEKVGSAQQVIIETKKCNFATVLMNSCFPLTTSRLVGYGKPKMEQKNLSLRKCEL